MFYNVELNFNKGDILTKEMLVEMYSFKNNYLDIIYSQNIDGVIAGLDVLFEDGNILLDKGLIKYNGFLYRMDEKFNLTEFVNEKFNENEISISIDYKIVLELSVTEYIDNRTSYKKTLLVPKILKRDEATSGIILLYTTLSSKASFSFFPEELFIEDDNLNLIECPYCINGSGTFHPYIFSFIKQILFKKKNKSDLENFILSDLTLNNVISLQFLASLLNDKFHKNYELKNNYNYQERKEILRLFVEFISGENMIITQPQLTQNQPPETPPQKKRISLRSQGI